MFPLVPFTHRLTVQTVLSFTHIVNRYKAKKNITCKQIHQHMMDTNVVLKVDAI